MKTKRLNGYKLILESGMNVFVCRIIWNVFLGNIDSLTFNLWQNIRCCVPLVFFSVFFLFVDVPIVCDNIEIRRLLQRLFFITTLSLRKLFSFFTITRNQFNFFLFVVSFDFLLILYLLVAAPLQKLPTERIYNNFFFVFFSVSLRVIFISTGALLLLLS